MHARIPPFQGKPYGWRLIGYCATYGCACALPYFPWGDVTFDDVTSGENALIGRILRNFRLRMRTPHLREPPSGVTWLSSLPVAMSVMRNGTFCTTTIVRKKRGNRLRMRRTYFRDWRHFRSGFLPVAPPSILLSPDRYVCNNYTI